MDLQLYSYRNSKSIIVMFAECLRAMNVLLYPVILCLLYSLTVSRYYCTYLLNLVASMRKPLVATICSGNISLTEAFAINIES